MFSDNIVKFQAGCCTENVLVVYISQQYQIKVKVILIHNLKTTNFFNFQNCKLVDQLFGNKSVND